MKKLIVYLLIIPSLNLWAKLPQNFMSPLTHDEELRIDSDSISQINQIIAVHDRAIKHNKIKRKGWYLDRLDVEVGITQEGSLGLFSSSHQAGVEFIWERDDSSTKNAERENTEMIPISITSTKEEIFYHLRDSILTFLNEETLSKSIRRKIMRTLYRDAQEISFMIQDLATMPQIGVWYVDGFFKTYTFGARGNLLDIVDIGYDKRIRFRFSFSGIPLKMDDPQELNIRQQLHRRVMEGLNQISRIENPLSRFELRRVWARVEFNKEIDLMVLKLSKGTGFQTVYKKSPNTETNLLAITTPLDSYVLQDFKRPHFIAQEFVEGIEPSSSPVFPLSQIRVKFSWEIESGYSILQIGKTSTLDLQFFRRKK